MQSNDPDLYGMSAGSLLQSDPTANFLFTGQQDLNVDQQPETLQLASSLNSVSSNEQPLPSILEEEHNKVTPSRPDCSFVTPSTTVVQNSSNDKVKFDAGYMCSDEREDSQYSIGNDSSKSGSKGNLS